MAAEPTRGWLARALRAALENRLIVALAVLLASGWGILVAPFAWDVPGLERDPVPVDALPDTGDNQQIVFTDWPGRSPQDVEDQVTYPLSVALLGVPGVKSVRSSSMFGFSSIYVIFGEDVEFYWSRSRLLEKLASLPPDTLPTGVEPTLGPDATALGQVFWYTLEGRDAEGQPAGGWDLHELRTIQDWYVRYALASVEGVAEVASVGGFVSEYQIDVDPDAMRAFGVTLTDVFQAVSNSNVDVGARTIEVNRAEYVVRGLGLLESLEDIEETVVGLRGGTPVTLRQIASVARGPADRRGALDKAGTEAVGGVVVARFGANPLAVIQRVKDKLAEIAPGMPSKVLADGRTSRVVVAPFYDRSQLIEETLATLNRALEHEVLVTLIVVLALVANLPTALLISGLLPLSVLLCFIAMKLFGVDANVVALAGIAIAIGTMVDVGIVMLESILKELEQAAPDERRLEVVWRGATSVGGAVLTAVLTTVISFLPVFTLEGPEGKLFKPLAYTKTFALIAAIVVALAVLPTCAQLVLAGGATRKLKRALGAVYLVAGVIIVWRVRWWIGAPLAVLGVWRLLEPHMPAQRAAAVRRALTLVCAVALVVLLARVWEPLGPARELANLVFAFALIGGVLLTFRLVIRIYEPILHWCLAHKALFLCAPLALVAFGALSWLGYERLTTPFARTSQAQLERSSVGQRLAQLFPGMGREFMPPLDEGSFLLMPVTMAHASIGEALEMLQQQDQLVRAIPEVDQVVGKIGRAESALDPAPISMVETIVTYKSEYRTDATGRRLRFAFDAATGEFERTAEGALVPDPDGRPFRQWRDSIQSPRDIWNAVEGAAALPGMTRASLLQPIETRRIMLQTGLRAPFGVKVTGPDLETLERVARDIEAELKSVPLIRPETVFAERVIGKPYLEIEIDRPQIARYGLSVRAVQDVIEVAIGGRTLTATVEGRERYPVRVRYPRERRDQIEELEHILVPTPSAAQVPLGQLATVRYAPGPQTIRSEDTFLVAYVLFDKLPDAAEVDVVEQAQRHLSASVASGALALPAGVNYRFAGDYENQQRAQAKLRVVLPLALILIFAVLYLAFRSVATTGIVFSAVFVAWAGGFILLWLYGQPWFLDLDVFGVNLRELFQVRPFNLSVAVWVGFLALFGIATDDGVLMATYLRDSFAEHQPASVSDIRAATVAAGARRVRPCLMTTATTLLALVPILTSTGRGADIMLPMALPSVGGMAVALVSIFVVPTLYCWVAELRLRRAD